MNESYQKSFSRKLDISKVDNSSNVGYMQMRCII